MADLPATEIPEKEQEEIREFAAILRLLPKEDRAVLLSNANALKLRKDIARAENNGADGRSRSTVKGRPEPEDAE